MTISRSVYNQLFEQAPDASGGPQEKVIRLRPTEAKAGAVVMSAKSKIQMWTKEEHDRFLAALEKFPAGPWKKVADFIGTKTPRQTMTHAQKYRQKISRRQRGLRNQKKSTGASTVNPIASAAAAAAAATGANPTPVDTKADLKGEPNTIVSPYGVADLQLKPGSEAAVAAAAGATNDQLLNILAQQATHIQDKPEGTEAEPMEVDATAEDATAEEAETSQDSSNKNLPSLAEILHLNGTEGEKEEEKKDEERTETEEEKETEDKKEVKATAETKAAAEAQPRPAECKCNCDCSAHGGQKPAVEETSTQPRPEEK